MIRKLNLALIVSTSLSYAVDPNFIKGSESLMHPDKIDLAPVNAATMLETGWLENLRLLWNVGIKESIEPYAQLRGTEIDNPHTQTALLLQFLFPSPDGAALALNNRDFFSLKGLTFSELGQTYNLADKGISPETYIRSKLEKNRRSEGGKLATVMLNAFLEDKAQFMPNLARHCFIAYVLKTAQSKEQIWDFLVAANLLNAPTDKTRQQYLSDQFSPLLYNEFKASLDSDFISPDEQQRREAYLDAFLSWKQQQIDAGTMTHSINGQPILKVPSVESITLSETAWKKFRPSAKTLELLKQNKESAYFLGHTYARTEKDTFIVEYGMSSWEEGNQRFNFSDCAEAAIFSFLNGLLFDQNTRRPNANNLPETTTPELKELYTTITESAKPLAAFRPQFSRLISNIEGLDYVKTSPSGGKYELVSSIDNLKQALIYLLGLDADIEDTYLLSAFNSDTSTFEVSATSPDTLNISRNDTPWLTIKSSNNHTEIKSHKLDIEWGHQISRRLLENNYENNTTTLSFISPALFESKYTWRILTAAEDSMPSNAQILTTALGLPLSGTKYRMKLLFESLSDRFHTQEALSSLTGIPAKASFDDPHTADGVLCLIATIGHERAKSIALSSNLYSLFIEQCKKSPIFAWAGFLLWRDSDLKPYLNNSLTEPQPNNPMELYLYVKIFMELFAGTPNRTDDIIPNRFIQKLQKPVDLQQQFMLAHQHLIQQNQNYKKNMAPLVIREILEEISDNFDSDALKAILSFSVVNEILIPFGYIHQRLITHPEITEDVIDLILAATTIPDSSEDTDLTQFQFLVALTYATKHEIILKILDKILKERPDFLFTQITTLNYTVLEGLLKSYNYNFDYQVFIRVKEYFPGSFITKRICELYTSHISATYNGSEQKATYIFTLTDEQRSNIRQFITEHKDEFKAMYDSEESTPNLLREILY